MSSNKKGIYLSVGIGANVDVEKLQSYYPDSAMSRPVLKAEASHFKEAFLWLGSEPMFPDFDIGAEIQTLPLPELLNIGI